MEGMLAKDAKNYHVWSYRQWLVRRFDLWDDASEMAYVEKLLDDDVRNNSAWNHRWFLAFGRPASGALSDELVVRREVDYAALKIAIAPQNESPWNYLRAIHAKAAGPAAIIKVTVVDLTLSFAGLEDGSTKSSHALDFLAAVYENDPEKKASAVKALDLLAEKYDPIRAPYWRYRKAMLGGVAAS
jgi:protein farnesyltransferase/geranylgeranyltransferase type-1 subunit alpha